MHGHGGEDDEDREEEDRGRGMQFNCLFRDASFNVVGRTEPVISILRVEQVSFMLSW